MTMNVSKGEFDRRVKLIEEKLKNIGGSGLQEKFNEFVERLNTIVSDNPDFNRYASIVNRIYSCFDTDTGQFDGSNIKPLTIDTAAISVGQRSQQLSLKNIKFIVDNYNDETNRSFYGKLKIVDDNNNQIQGTYGELTHYTLFDAVNQDNTTSATIATFKINFSSGNDILIGTNEFYYIYAKLPCERQNGIYLYDINAQNIALIEISTNKIKIDENYSSTNKFLYILLGTISKELEASGDADKKYYRIVDLNYGLTTINGRLITTGRIEGNSSNSAWFDLDKGEIGGKIKFRNTTTQTDDDINDIVTGTTEIAGGMISNNLILLKPVQYFIKDYVSTNHYGIKINNNFIGIEIHEIDGVGLYPSVYIDNNNTLVYGLLLYEQNDLSTPLEAVEGVGLVSGGISGNRFQKYPAIWAGGTTNAAEMIRSTRNRWRDSTWTPYYSSSDESVYDALLRLKSYLPSVFIDFDGVSRFGNVWLYGDSVKFESAFDLSGSNITGILPISKGGTNNNSFTTNYLTYYNNQNKISTTSKLSSDGNYLHILNDTDVGGTTTPTNAPFTIGTLTSQHIEIDANEILSKSNGTTPSTLYLQDSTGYVEVAGSGLGVCGTNTGYNLYVNGTSYLNGSIYIGSNNIYSYYNSSNYPVIRNYTNGNITMNACGTGLFLGYENTTYIDFLYGDGRWTSTGFGIGTTSPAYKLDVNGKIRTKNTIIAYRYNTANNLPAITMDKPGSNYVGIGADGTSNRIKFGPCTNIDGDAWVAQSTFNSNQWFFQGYIHATNGIDSESYVTALATNSSDKRLKKNIKPFNATEIVDKLKPVQFEWNKKANKYNNNLELNKKNYGLIAQDSDGIIDDLVFDLPDGKGYKGVRYEKLIPILLQAVKEQQKEIDELKIHCQTIKE